MSRQAITRPNRRGGQAWLTLGLGPGVAWLVLLVALPFLALVAVSFMSRGDYGQIQLPLTLENYKRLAGFDLLGFDPLYPKILLRSMVMAAATGALCLAFALPAAFFIASLPKRWKGVALTLAVIPLWTNLLVRTYAWQILLAPEGAVTALARMAGLVDAGQGLYPGALAVYLGLVCDYLPFCLLPIYASVEKMNPALLDAVRDLGGGALSVFRHGVVPQIKPGLAAGVLLVVLPALGQFIIPDLLGGAQTVLLGNLLQQQFGASRDWPFGSAIATVAMVAALAGIALRLRIAAPGRGEVAD